MISLGPRVRRWLEQATHHASFLLMHRRRHRRLVLEDVAGLQLVILPEVFHPALFSSSQLLAKAIAGEALEGKHVLEVGTGSGFLALQAASRAAHTIGVDINPEAVRALRINALLNRLEEKVEARQGDLFAAVAGDRFDLILFNPPYFAGQAKEPWDYAWRDVDQTRARFVAQAGQHLRPGGRLLIVDSSLAVDRMDQALAAAGFRIAPVRTETVGVSGEVLTVFAASPEPRA